MERYANNATTTITAALDNVVTVIPVASASGFPTLGIFRIVIDNEIMEVNSVSGLNFTVTRGREGTANVAHSNGATVGAVLTSAGLQSAFNYCQGRLTITSGLPVGTANSSNTRIYFTPYQGNRISLYNGNTWDIYAFTELQNIPTIKAGMLYDVFITCPSGPMTSNPSLIVTPWAATQSAGTITAATNASPINITTSSPIGVSNGNLVLITGVGGNTAANNFIWVASGVSGNSFNLSNSTGNGAYTSGGVAAIVPTARDTNLAYQDGVLSYSGDYRQRYLGTIMANYNANFEDSESRRFIWNYQNRVRRHLRRIEPAANWTYGVIQGRFANNNPANRVEICIGGSTAEVTVDLTLHVNILMGAAQADAQHYFGVDGITQNPNQL